MKEINKDDVCIFIPTLNEAKNIKKLITQFKEQGYSNILVVDGHSSDKTPEIAKDAGATLITQQGKGKGQAIKQAFKYIRTPYTIMIDGDATYKPEEVSTLLKPLQEGIDHVMGNRFANYKEGAFTRLNMVGNKIMNKMFGFAYGVWFNDILTGYRGFNNKAIKTFELNETGFEIETEMTIETIKKHLTVTEVPITYLRRRGDPTKLHPFEDGIRIMSTIFKLTKLHNPLFYFGIIGILMTVTGVTVGIYIVLEWLKGIDHIPLTILATLLIMGGIQIFMFGLLGDLVVTLHREVLRGIQKKK
ncbi:MAG: Glycosyltransferase AglJ [Candidatus Argoarchaeum ethanivorans]|uniref:Glycosyltransferase AglJ n=2 Tax=Candidatus Argoarchaeum ethanivorans TaxID=2608793 RepID=A0A811T7A3_9EURY|nr:MAG: Glycosyltransferase AglJ [Candidatus Argoarchaeum ethanivorans]CAD6492181.1 MAG: Glycosyltransferase AglJ [Candidatus Argoarchaeum ethanivorans]